ncbi:HNH endonuclease [Micromonospora sp. A3M-1-15]|uniref:HNH endonuclease n=1 Tax=Micromonospora sp. A3M-1-15 TaxID=2962035 RepID=UPI0020B723ED|nr:HNH endonuclease [Micromonospora sp. A3M-1-15]MCP3782952.1 HNH endonuclease [Micromonospora sp. A3M-1-15]
METLLCLAASLVFDRRKYGGSTSHLAGEPVPTLARLFKRPNGSIIAKMSNLDGSLAHGAKHEVHVAAQLLGSPAQLDASYRLILDSARMAGIGPDELPDFLGLEDDDELVLLGQEELLQSDLEVAVQAQVARWAEKFPDIAEPVTERLLTAAARVGQHRFARNVLQNNGHRCTFCGLGVRAGGLRAQRMLVASHIKPWRVSNSGERLDPRNGIAACPTHDVAFDTGLLTIDHDLRIHVRPEVQEAAEDDTAVRSSFGRPPLAQHLLLPQNAIPPGVRYLDWHYEHVYRRVGGARPPSFTPECPLVA